MARVESYLARHPQVARQLDLVRDEQEQTVVANETLGWPSAGALDRLMAGLPRNAFGRSAAKARSALFFQAYLGVLHVRRPPAACAGRRPAWQRWSRFRPSPLPRCSSAIAAGATRWPRAQQAGGDGVSALVAFTDEATAPAISRLLTEFRAKIVDGPRSGGLYKIRLRLEDRSQAEAQLKRLEERRDIVRAVLPSRD